MHDSSKISGQYTMKYQSRVSRFLFYSYLMIFIVGCTEKGQRSADDAQGFEHRDTSSVTEDISQLADTLPGDIEGIQKVYGKITGQLSQGALDSTSFTYNCKNEILGSVTYYSHNGRLRMIQHRYNEYDHHAATDQYYIIDSTLFFVYRHQLLWSFESGPEGSTKDDITEQRVYFIDQKPIRCLEKKYIVRSADTNKPDSENIPNKEVNCSSINPLMEPYQNLLKNQYEKAVDCL